MSPRKHKSKSKMVTSQPTHIQTSERNIQEVSHESPRINNDIHHEVSNNDNTEVLEHTKTSRSNSNLKDIELPKAMSPVKVSEPEKCSQGNPAGINKVEQSKKSNSTEVKGQQEQNNSNTKSKAQLRAERRQIQEAQRAAKATKPQQPQQNKQPQQQQDKQQQNQQQQNKQDQQNKQTRHQQQQPLNVPKPQISLPAEKSGKKKKEETKQLFEEFAHLPIFRIDSADARDNLLEGDDIHPSILKLGLKLACKKIIDPWNIMKALTLAIKEFIGDYEPSNTEYLVRDFLEELKVQTLYLNTCRPLSVGMENLLKHLKYHVKMLTKVTELKEFKSSVRHIVDSFHDINLKLAQKNISNEFTNNLSDEEVIVTYSYSKVVLKCLYDARKNGKNFKVIVIDQHPTILGRKMVESLMAIDIECSLGLIHQSNMYMPGATKVVMAAEAAFANGNILTKSGGPRLLMNAMDNNVPSVILCETFRFSDSKPINSFMCNVIVETEDNRLSVLYDVMPANLVTAIVTEMGLRSPHTVETIMKTKWASTYMLS